MLAKDGFYVGGCLHDQTERQQKSHSPKEKTHDLREALRDARFRKITRKDLREDAATGIDNTASLHLLSEIQTAHTVATRTAESNTHEWGLGVRCLKPGRRAGVWRVACAQHVERHQGPRTSMWRCQERQYAVVREKFMTKKAEEQLRRESRLTPTTLLLQRSEELITWNEIHRREDEVCAKTAAEKPKEAVHTDGKRHKTCGLDGRKRVPQGHVTGCGCRAGTAFA